jgi:mRNA interferase RelE/StbE
MATTYDIRVAPAAERQLKKLVPSLQVKILEKLETLSTNPRPSGVEKLSSDPRFWRIRVGDYRIIYWIDDNAKILVALIVRHRKDAYRDIGKLDPATVAKTLGPLLTGLAVGM